MNTGVSGNYERSRRLGWLAKRACEDGSGDPAEFEAASARFCEALDEMDRLATSGDAALRVLAAHYGPERLYERGIAAIGPETAAKADEARRRAIEDDPEDRFILVPKRPAPPDPKLSSLRWAQERLQLSGEGAVVAAAAFERLMDELKAYEDVASEATGWGSVVISKAIVHYFGADHASLIVASDIRGEAEDLDRVPRADRLSG